MSRLELIVYQNPGQADIFLNIKTADGTFHRVTAIVDTGAEISLLPDILLPSIAYQLTEPAGYTIDQAGITRQSFYVQEAGITVFLEDIHSNRSSEFRIVAWFGNTDKIIIGFGGILERAIFHLDMPNLSGYLEFPDPSPA